MKINYLKHLGFGFAFVLVLACFTDQLVAATGVPGVADKDSASVVDVSHGCGIMLGGLGTGYSAFGKYGFIRVNFDGTTGPDRHPYKWLTKDSVYWNYTMVPDPSLRASFGFTLKKDNTTYVLQEDAAGWASDAIPFDRVSSYAFMPEAYFVYNKAGLGLDVSIRAFSPLIAHDLQTSSTPVQVYDVTVKNSSLKETSVELRLMNNATGIPDGNKVVFGPGTGQIAFGAEGGQADSQGVIIRLKLNANQSKTARFLISWYYPAISYASALPAKGNYKRFYTKAFANASEVIDKGIKSADEWLKKIDTWHDAINVPAYFKTMWFSSLGSIMTSTILTSDPYFVEIETPHTGSVNTFDVVVYSGWVYMINWPEIEKMDMDQATDYIPVSGTEAGIVSHCWRGGYNDSYFEGPIYPVRLFRDYLWFNDSAWARKGFSKAVTVVNRLHTVYNYNADTLLLNDLDGNQGYDGWKMPGISAYNNSSWIYGLYAMDYMSAVFKQPVTIQNIPLVQYMAKAASDFDKVLWNPKNYWNVFHRTPGASSYHIADMAFTDQLFGKWVVSVSPAFENVLSPAKVRSALEKLYVFNLIEDKTANFRGWVNGMKSDRTIYRVGHPMTCWFAAQQDLGSLLGVSGNEAASLDVFRSVSTSLGKNALAAGEWNRSADSDFTAKTIYERGKDTPRFPPYPRYKCSWEYLVRILGMQMDEKYIYLKPFKSIDFAINNFKLAGINLTARVAKNWNKVKLNGSLITGTVKIDRSLSACTVEFLN